VKFKGTFVEFAGYELPVKYAGVIAEARAVRSSAGTFDVSHMARFKFEGEGVAEFLDAITANDVLKLSDHSGQYSLLTNERGGCVDDIITYRVSEGDFRMVVNASNHAKDLTWIRSRLPQGVTLTDETANTCMIALQGPKALQTLQANSDAAEELAAAPMFGIVFAKVVNVDCFIARSGYTGEDGFEIICRAEEGPGLWDSLNQDPVVPCGLGARDVLRVESGLPLYGHELSDEINPIEAGLGWVIKKHRPFVGSAPIEAARAAGTRRKLQGIRLEAKRIPAPDAAVLVDGEPAGVITSGVYSPGLDCGIGFAFVDSKIPLDTPCSVEVRGAREPAQIVSKRFLKSPEWQARKVT